MTNEKTLKNRKNFLQRIVNSSTSNTSTWDIPDRKNGRLYLNCTENARITIEPVGIRVICQCLMEWRNREIQAKKHGAVDAINRLLIWFIR